MRAIEGNYAAAFRIKGMTIERPNSRAVKLDVFLPDGSPDGLKLITRANWDGQGTAFPRLNYPAVRLRPDLNTSGVYVLSGPDDTFGSRIYVGESECLVARLDQHLKTKDFWSEALLFHSRTDGLNRAHIKYIESELVRLARESGRVACVNTQTPRPPRLNELEVSVANGFLRNRLMIYPLLGCHAFESVVPIPKESIGASTARLQSPTLFLQFRGSDARGVQTADGFVVFRGSVATASEQPSFTPRTYGQLRSRLLEEGVLERQGNHLVFTRDYLFRSQSAAFSVTTGQEQSGKMHWRDAEGRTLKDIEQSLLKQTSDDHK